MLKDEIFQLTHTTHLGFVYEREIPALKRTFSYPTEGWEPTCGDGGPIMAAGSSILYYLNPATGREKRRIAISDGWGPVASMSEPEYAGGEIYAKVWMAEGIAVVSARSGEVRGPTWRD